MSVIKTPFDPAPMPQIAAVRALADTCVEVRWAEGTRAGRTEIVDLSPIINLFRVFTPLRGNAELFATVSLADDGSVLEWAGGDFDLAATTVEQLAKEQMTGADFEAFLERNKLTRAAAGAELGRSLRNIQDYVADPKALLPRIVALACFGYEAKKNPWQTLFAIYAEKLPDYQFKVDKPEPARTENNNQTETPFRSPYYRQA